VQDGDGGRLALAAFREQVRFPKVIWADQAYAAIVGWALVKWLWCVDLVKRPRCRFEVPPKRWIVERTFGRWNKTPFAAPPTGETRKFGGHVGE